jgi:hypothetical protein
MGWTDGENLDFGFLRSFSGFSPEVGLIRLSQGNYAHKDFLVTLDFSINVITL